MWSCAAGEKSTQTTKRLCQTLKVLSRRKTARAEKKVIGINGILGKPCPTSLKKTQEEQKGGGELTTKKRRECTVKPTAPSTLIKEDFKVRKGEQKYESEE